MSTGHLPRILVLGAGGHAEACIDVIEQTGLYAIAGLVGLPDQIGQRVLGYPVLAADDALPSLLPSVQYALVALGQIKSPEARIRLYQMVAAVGRQPPAIVSPSAYVSPHAVLGGGSIVMPGAVVNAGAVLGVNCIVNSLALVEHGSRIGDHCHIATGVRVNGAVCIGEGSFIGSGAILRQGISIGTRCIIGMGQSVRADCLDGHRQPAGKK